MSDSSPVVGDFSVLGTALAIAIGLATLGVRLYGIQVLESDRYADAGDVQSVRSVLTGGERGRILDRNGNILAENRKAVSIVLTPDEFKRSTRNATMSGITGAIDRVASAVGYRPAITDRAIERHVRQSPAMPMFVWRDIDDATLAKFCEREPGFPGFSIEETFERRYPYGSAAAHVIGYVGRDTADAGESRYHYSAQEMKGRSGIESYYDGYLRGVPGETRIVVDSRGYRVESKVVVEPKYGLDLRLALDIGLQLAVERQLAGETGACAAIDPRNGDVLALASSPSFDLNSFVPTLSRELYTRYADDPAEPLLNRASGGSYAPGSTFKPVTALAGLKAGYPEDAEYECTGAFAYGSMQLRCARRWGHGLLDIRHAIKESCNTFFCNLGADIGTNALVSAARAFGLGSKTGLDLGVDAAGVVPDAQWKMRTYREKWYYGDLVQMSIGQGMLLTTPLQMARVAGAIGTGYLVLPRLNLEIPVERTKLPFAEKDLAVVRDGMRMVVDGGTGRLGGEGVPVAVAGKTGTAEVGKGERRRKNAWFIAYAPAENPSFAIAMVIENGDSGGGTTAPKVDAILKRVFGDG
ncbi:MAG: penicillin-binding protein 2 [Kiritimatiellae bacterium]|nr:penicillin-binding protein 2 [Kiritimatiellia bacterium]